MLRLRPRKVAVVFVTLTGAAMLLAASSASASFCSNPPGLPIPQQGLRGGTHDASEGGLTDESIHAERGDLDSRFGERGRDGSAGVGRMQGNGLGSYGAGSIGERGPGGLGAMTGSGLGQRTGQQRPR